MSTVRLRDGREVLSWSEEHRHESEARMILAIPTLLGRRAWLEDIEEVRGRAAADALCSTMSLLHDDRIAAKGPP